MHPKRNSKKHPLALKHVVNVIILDPNDPNKLKTLDILFKVDNNTKKMITSTLLSLENTKGQAQGRGSTST